jgi:hypothetical protein
MPMSPPQLNQYVAERQPLDNVVDAITTYTQKKSLLDSAQGDFNNATTALDAAVNAAIDAEVALHTIVLVLPSGYVPPPFTPPSRP